VIRPNGNQITRDCVVFVLVSVNLAMKMETIAAIGKTVNVLPQEQVLVVMGIIATDTLTSSSRWMLL